MSVLRSPPGPSSVVFFIEGPIGRGELPELCERARSALQGCDADVVVCDVGRVYPDAVAVDALARLQLTARRLGREVRLRRACGELRELLALVGLREVLPPFVGSLPEAVWLPLQAPRSGAPRSLGLPLESKRQTEGWEQRRGVEEEADPRDPTV